MERPKKTFYRRVLPDVCISFASAKGRQLFKDALPTGYLNCYFPLASQFRTQEEPAYCGLSSLVMVLNALAVDPGVVWKGVFRWYHEDMLDCCTLLEEVKVKGVTMDGLFCLALCNQLDGKLNRVEGGLTCDTFRQEIKEVTSQDDRAMIISYGRDVLKQTGTGHFSPVGGYNEQEDMVLILDVARFKYPPYWVPLSEMWLAMKSQDTETGLPRGYMTLWRADQETMPGQPPMLFKLSGKLNAFQPMLVEAGQLLKETYVFLNRQVQEEGDIETLKTIVKKLLDTSFSHQSGTGSANLLSLKVTEHQLEEAAHTQVEMFRQLVLAIEETTIYKQLVKLVPSDLCCARALFDVGGASRSTSKCQSSFKFASAETDCVVCLPHFLTVFLLSLPPSGHRCHCRSGTENLAAKQPGKSYAEFLNDLVGKELDQGACPRPAEPGPEKEQKHGLLLNEVKQLQRQFSALMSAQSV